jgi:hypothetical protein
MNLTREVEVYRSVGNGTARKGNRLTLLGTPFKPRVEEQQINEEYNKENSMASRKLAKPTRFANLGTPFASKTKPVNPDDVVEGAGGISFQI